MTQHRYATLADYLAVLNRRKWVILAVLVAAIAAAYGFSSRQQREYSASAQVLVSANSAVQSLVEGAGAGGQNSSSAMARYVAEQASVAHTTAITTLAIDRSHLTGQTPQSTLGMYSSSASLTANIISFTATNRTPSEAVAVVNAVANAYVVFRTQQDVQMVNQQLATIVSQIKDLTTQITALSSSGQSTVALRGALEKLVGKRAQLQSAASGAAHDTSVSQLAGSATQTQPNPLKDTGLGAILGLMLGIVVAFVIEALDSRVRAADEVGEALGTTLLTRIPTPSRKLRGGTTLAMVDGDVEATEPYRKLRVNLDFANVPVRARRIMITSAVEQEGKSTTAANLAYALAAAGRRVTLVDLDLRRPYLHNFFGIEARPGATDVMLGHCTLGEALVAVRVPDAVSGGLGSLHILAAGTATPNPAELIDGPSLDAILESVAEESDVVLVDAAPLLPVSDSVALSRHVDGIVVIVRAELVSRRTLSELQRSLGTLTTPMLGYVLTGAEADGGYGYKGYYGSSAAPAAAPRTHQRVTLEPSHQVGVRSGVRGDGG